VNLTINHSLLFNTILRISNIPLEFMTHNIQRLHCAIEIDILLEEISNKETSRR